MICSASFTVIILRHRARRPQRHDGIGAPIGRDEDEVGVERRGDEDGDTRRGERDQESGEHPGYVEVVRGVAAVEAGPEFRLIRRIGRAYDRQSFRRPDQRHPRVIRGNPRLREVFDGEPRRQNTQTLRRRRTHPTRLVTRSVQDVLRIRTRAVPVHYLDRLFTSRPVVSGPARVAHERACLSALHSADDQACHFDELGPGHVFGSAEEHRRVCPWDRLLAEITPKPSLVMLNTAAAPTLFTLRVLTWAAVAAASTASLRREGRHIAAVDDQRERLVRHCRIAGVGLLLGPVAVTFSRRRCRRAAIQLGVPERSFATGKRRITMGQDSLRRCATSPTVGLPARPPAGRRDRLQTQFGLSAWRTHGRHRRHTTKKAKLPSCLRRPPHTVALLGPCGLLRHSDSTQSPSFRVELPPQGVLTSSLHDLLIRDAAILLLGPKDDTVLPGGASLPPRTPIATSPDPGTKLRSSRWLPPTWDNAYSDVRAHLRGELLLTSGPPIEAIVP